MAAVDPVVAATRGPLREDRPVRWWALLAVPGLGFLTVFFVAPLLVVVVRSVTDPSPVNYAEVFGSPTYLTVLAVTGRTAAVVTASCLLLGYPYALALRRAGRWLHVTLLAAVLVPFWSSLLVRTYAWTVLLRDTGVVNQAVQGLGLTDGPIPLLRNSVGVTIGMTHVLLPFMVLPVYAALARIPSDVLDAASGLGGPVVVFRRVLMPLSAPGALAGCLLVFGFSLGFYLTPALLGGPGHWMFAQLVVDAFSARLRFGLGSALALVLLGAALACVAAAVRMLRTLDVFGIRGSR